MDKVVFIGTSSLGTSKSISLDGAKRLALMNIENFIRTFSDPHIFSVIVTSSAPATLAQAAEIVHIQEAGHLRCRFIFSLFQETFFFIIRKPKLVYHFLSSWTSKGLKFHL